MLKLKTGNKKLFPELSGILTRYRMEWAGNENIEK
jgi:hypothetical protein